MVYGSFFVVGLTALLFLGPSCAPREVPVLAPEAPAPEKPAVAEKTGWEAEWEKTLQAARKEGRVVVYVSTPALGLKEAVPILKDKFGLDLQVMSGRGGELRTKLLQERAAGLKIVDVMIAGSNTMFGAVKAAGATIPLEPALILPEVRDAKLWVNEVLPFKDGALHVFTFYAYPTPQAAINTDLVKPRKEWSYYDLLKPEWKNKVIINDPTMTGTAFNGFSTFILHKVLDLDYFRQLVRNQSMVTRDQRLQIDWLARGKYHIAFWPHSQEMADYKGADAPVTEVQFKEGIYMSVDGSGTALLEGAPHPNAARIFLNWLFSREGQTLMQEFMLMQSARTDITTKRLEMLGPEKVRQPGFTYLASANDSENWVLQEQDKYMKMAQEVFAPLLR